MTQPPEDPFAPISGPPPVPRPDHAPPPPPLSAADPWHAQQWQGGQWQQPWPSPPKTNVLAILSLVFAFLCAPVGIVLGIIALSQLRSSNETGRGLAIGGLTTSAAFTIIPAAIVALVFAVGSELYEGEGRVSQVGSTVIGACLSGSQDGGVSQLVDCSEAHEEEVFAVERAPDDAWPGADELDSRADDLCHGEFSGYVGTGYFDSEYDYSWYRPDQAEWSGGERRLVCVVIGDMGPGEGSVQGSER